MSRIILPGLAVLTILGSLAVRADDIADIKAREIIAAQKLKSQVSDAIASSRKLELTKPVDARLLIERTLRDVDASLDLSPADKTTLTRQLNARLTEVNNAAQKKAIEKSQEPRSTRDIDRAGKTASPGSSRGSGVSDAAGAKIGSIKGTVDSNRDTVRDREKSKLGRAGRELRRPVRSRPTSRLRCRKTGKN